MTVYVDAWVASQGQRSVALTCGQRNVHRSLTTQEADVFLRHARDSRLYRARGIGADLRASDLWLATMKVTDSGQIVILVISGNPEFASGPRRDLVAFLLNLFTELRTRIDSVTGK